MNTIKLNLDYTNLYSLKKVRSKLTNDIDLNPLKHEVMTYECD